MAYQQFDANTRQSTTFAPSMLHLLVAANSIGPIFRAFSSGNNSLLAFILFVYSSFFSLEYCFTVYHQRFPRNANPPQKKLLAVAIWLLFSGIIFGLVYQFASHIFLIFDAILYGVAFVASAVIFYVYVIYSNKLCVDHRSCGTGEEVVFSDLVLEKV